MVVSVSTENLHIEVSLIVLTIGRGLIYTVTESIEVQANAPVTLK